MNKKIMSFIESGKTLNVALVGASLLALLLSLIPDIPDRHNAALFMISAVTALAGIRGKF